MSTDVRDIIVLFERLTEPQRQQVTSYARSLVERSDPPAVPESFDRWLAKVRGTAVPGVTTDAIMEMTRGES